MAKDFLRLREIDLETTSDKLISILIDADMPEPEMREMRDLETKINQLNC